MNKNIAIKRLLSALTSCVGLQSLAESFLLNEKAFVLMYHRVLESRDARGYHVQAGMCVEFNTFKKQICFLKRRFRIVFLDDLIERSVKGKKMGGLCAITFDDGWRDNYINAFPILEKYDVPATVFLASGFVGTGKIFWPEELSFCLNHIDLDIINKGPPAVQQMIKDLAEYKKMGKGIFYDKAIEIAKKLAVGQRSELLAYLKSQIKRKETPVDILSWDEARRMQASGRIRFGAHSVNHEILDQLSLEHAKKEIAESRSDIVGKLGGEVKVFAYPNGNYNEVIKKLVKDCGFKGAVTTRKGFLDQNTPLLEIPRIGVHEDISNTVPMFRNRILFKRF